MNNRLRTFLQLISFYLILFFSQPSFAELFTVQVGAFSSPNPATISLARDIEEGKLYGSFDSKLHRYYIGRYESREMAEIKLTFIRDKGFPDAFLATYSNNFHPVNGMQLANIVSGTDQSTTGATVTRKAVIKKLSVAEIESALAKLSAENREKVVLIDGKLWLKENGKLQPLPLS